ncbi:hypothetical protein Taro_031103, partial [Colocasia esculenta]|nr:hypothetical protein [Colocasia esculenta]
LVASASAIRALLPPLFLSPPCCSPHVRRRCCCCSRLLAARRSTPCRRRLPVNSRTASHSSPSTIVLSSPCCSPSSLLCKQGSISLPSLYILLLFSKKKVPNRGQELLGVASDANHREVRHHGFTGIQHVQFCLNHLYSSVYVGIPRGNDSLEKQTLNVL